MNLLPGTQQIVGDGDIAIGGSGKPVRIFSIEVISGGTASTVLLFNGTSIVAGNQFGQIDGTASKSALVNYAGGKLFSSGCFLQTDANSAFTTVVYTMEL
jgi:hypothetical protein